MEMKARRKAVPAEVREEASKIVCRRLLEREDVRTALANKAAIAVYLASSDEIDLTPFIVTALRQGAMLLAPRWTGVTYELAALGSLDRLVCGPHGIFEPPPSNPRSPTPSPRIWLVPGLAFTRDGTRLGYGGGWYDRFLSAADPASVKLGLAYGFQIADDLPSEPHDQRLSEIVVPVCSAGDARSPQDRGFMLKYAYQQQKLVEGSNT